jgi:hypothetical protein
MRIAIRTATLPDELELLRSLHNANRTSPSGRERFLWSYIDNPAGHARAWVADDVDLGQPVGFAAALPCHARLGDGRVVVGWNCADCSVMTSHRGHGIAVSLRRATRASVDAGQAAFLFGQSASAAMFGVHVKAGHRELGRMVQLWWPIGLPGLPRRLAALAVHAVAALRGLPTPDPACEFTGTADPGASLPDLAAFQAEVFKGPARTSLVRSSDHVRWRFLLHPRSPSELLCVYSRGRLLGYLVWSRGGREATLHDWVVESEHVLGLLLRELIARCAGVTRVSTALLEGHPHLAALKGHGFIERGKATRVVVYSPEQSPAAEWVNGPERWYMTLGDRDI